MKVGDTVTTGGLCWRLEAIKGDAAILWRSDFGTCQEPVSSLRPFIGVPEVCRHPGEEK
jgi:hypothetical protein